MMDWADEGAGHLITDSDLQEKFGGKMNLLIRVEEAL